MDKLQYKIASWISIACLVIILYHWVMPSFFTINKEIIIIIAMGLTPWIIPFIKKFKVGPVEGETYDRSQGTTLNPPPPQPVVQETSGKDEEVSNDAKKILATLWKYQKQIFQNDKIKRWTFAVSPMGPLYNSYLSGLSELFKRGLIVINPENNQCMLTNEGIAFIEERKDIQEYKDIYKF